MPVRGDGVIISEQLASKGVRLGQQVATPTPAMSMTIVGVTGRSSFGHVPAAYTSLQTWQHLRFSIPAGHTLTSAVDQATGGERQRVAIARALMNDPAMLLVDEPTASIDLTQTTAIVQLPAEQAHCRGCTLIMVTHEPAAIRACDRTVAIAELTEASVTL